MGTHNSVPLKLTAAEEAVIPKEVETVLESTVGPGSPTARGRQQRG